MIDAPLWLVGCGAMGGAMLSRWVAAGVDPALVTVITRGAATVPDGVRHMHVPPPGERPDVLVLAVKPQQLDAVAPSLAGSEPRVLVSILAGVEEAALARRIPAGAAVRAMPNLPVAIGKGVTALYTSGGDAAARAMAEALARPLGEVEWIADEALFDAVTALAGCGPGFVFRFCEALAAAGERLGLTAEQALRLARWTLAGAAEMAALSEDSPVTLADRVASPGGSTREGLNVLDREDALKRLLAETLAASAARNRELASAARG